jgi:hypothetical protein
MILPQSLEYHLYLNPIQNYFASILYNDVKNPRAATDHFGGEFGIIRLHMCWRGVDGNGAGGDACSTRAGLNGNLKYKKLTMDDRKERS